MNRIDRRRAWPLLVFGLLLAAGLLAVARPQRVVQLATGAQPSGLAAAFVVTAAVAALRGLRLKVVVGRSLDSLRALAVHAVTQFSAAVVPMRLGEAAILPLLHRAGVPGLLRGVSVAVTVRLLDLLALLVWATIAGVWLGARGVLAGMVLVIAVATVLGVAALAQKLLAAAAGRYRHASPRWRRVLRQALQVRAELKRLAATPGRAAAAMALSLAAWGGVWGVTVLLVQAMGLTWPAASVLWGTLGATLGAALPINAVGNFGTMEAGWTAALTALGIPADQALAAGFATHAWSLVFNAALAAAAVPLSLRPPRAPSAASLATRKARRSA